MREICHVIHIKGKTLSTFEDNNIIVIEQTLDAPIVNNGRHIVNHGVEIINPMLLQSLNIKSGNGIKPDSLFMLIVPLNVRDILIENAVTKTIKVSDLTSYNSIIVIIAIIITSNGLKDTHTARPVPHVSPLLRKLISNHIKRSNDTTSSIHINFAKNISILLDIGHRIDKKILMEVGIGAKFATSCKVVIDMAEVTKLNGMTSLRATVIKDGQALLAILLSFSRKIGRHKPLALVSIVGSNNELHIRH